MEKLWSQNSQVPQPISNLNSEIDLEFIRELIKIHAK
jgi:hypothetical protein